MKSSSSKITGLAPKNSVASRLTLAVLAVVLVLADGCHKDAVAPVAINIRFGYEASYENSNYGGATFVPFKNQSQISAADLMTFTQMTPGATGIEIGLRETGVPCNALGFSNSGTTPPLNSLEFLINVSTSNEFQRDKEIFVTGKNGWTAAIGDGWNPNNNCSLDLYYAFPIKLTNHFVVNNDTLEINPKDTVKIAYRSLYTSKTSSVKLAVTP